LVAIRVSIHPLGVYKLPVVFRPVEESPAPGKVTIGTEQESWDVELLGSGREAVLILSKMSLEFTECIVGNVYEHKLGLKNIGDVNYPVDFKLDPALADAELKPQSVILQPFSEEIMTVHYKPSAETRDTISLLVSSPYSSHSIPIYFHAGYVQLDFTATKLLFGMFEKSSKPTVNFAFKNSGSVKTSYSVKASSKAHAFQITNAKGFLNPGKWVEISVTHILHEVHSFDEKFVVKTDLVDKQYVVSAIGECEEALVKEEEFSTINMGTCPVLEATVKQFNLTNYGKYPLRYEVKYSYPIKVYPAEGEVKGGQSLPLSVSWSPSGGYELRSSMKILTNIGAYDSVVRGKATFPDLQIKNSSIDFGVCAVSYTYKETFQLVNRGKVQLKWSIPPVRECFQLSEAQGVLEPKETKDVTILFTPDAIGRFVSNLIIESKGLNFKEINIAGIGGLLKLDIDPDFLELGNCPCDQYVQCEVKLKNSGDVTLSLAFAEDESSEENSSCELQLPAHLVLKPQRSARLQFSVHAKEVGSFTKTLLIQSKEEKYRIRISGEH
jgi:hypothetical protein